MQIRKIGVIGRTYRQIERYAEIIRVLFRFGFGDLVTSLKVEQYLDLGRRVFFRGREKKIEKLTRAERFRLVLEELGPTFIKFGQMLSTRQDLMPADFIDELIKLQDKAPPFEFEEVVKILDQELKGGTEDVFPFIDPTPLAAASIGQVHRARLFDGEEVVIKVQRPGIRRVVEVDLEILLHLASLVEKHMEGWDLHRPTEVVEEFGRSLDREMDYMIEASNMELFASQFMEDPQVYIPKVFRDYSTGRVLVMEFVEGIQARDLDALRRAGADLPGIARTGARIIMRQTLISGLFHADPHPGNLLILPGDVICLLDMGMVGRLDRPTREDVVDLLMGVVRQDSSAMVEALLRLTEWEEEPDSKGLGRSASEFVAVHLNRPLKELHLGRLLTEVFEIASRYKMRVPADLLLLIKAISATEGLGRLLDPEFDIISTASPFVRQVQIQRMSPRRLSEDLWDFSTDMINIAKDLPGEFRVLLRMARKGKLKVEVESVGWEEMRITLSRASNRLSFAIVLAALIIGSSVIVHSGIPPTWHGIPLIGLAGYIVAGVMGFWLIISILRRGMM